MISSVFFIVLISVAILCLVLYHILGPSEVWDVDQAEGSLTLLQRRRDRVLRTLKDIELEKETGTLSEDEFYRLRQDLKRQAIQSMKKLDRSRVARIRHLKRNRASVSPSHRERVERLVEDRKEKA